jgi:hypothetical protein
MGEAKRKVLAHRRKTIALDTFGGRIHVEWDPTAAVTPLGQLPFFIEFLKVSGLFEAWVMDCPLAYQSNNASDKRAVLATFLLSILAGHHRYAHITAIRNDGIHPELLGVAQLVSEDAARRALARIDEPSGVAWLDRHLAKTTQALLATPWILDLDATVKCLYGKQEGLQPEETRTAFAQLSQCADGKHAAGIGGGSDGGQRDGAHAQHAWDLGLSGCVAEGGAPRLAAR